MKRTSKQFTESALPPIRTKNINLPPARFPKMNAFFRDQKEYMDTLGAKEAEHVDKRFVKSEQRISGGIIDDFTSQPNDRKDEVMVIAALMTVYADLPGFGPWLQSSGKAAFYGETVAAYINKCETDSVDLPFKTPEAQAAVANVIRNNIGTPQEIRDVTREQNRAYLDRVDDSYKKDWEADARLVLPSLNAPRLRACYDRTTDGIAMALWKANAEMAKLFGGGPDSSLN